MGNRDVSSLEWREEFNGVTIDCSLQIAKHSGGNTVFLIIPGVDGSLDGFEDKYLRIAEGVHSKHGHTVYQMENPFITSQHWESNVRQMLDHIYLDHDVDEIHVMAHSAGAWTIGKIAHEFPEINKLLLVNPATNDVDSYVEGLAKAPYIHTNFVLGEKDPSAAYGEQFRDIENHHGVNVVVVEEADHHFSGDALNHFIDAPHIYLYKQ
ncbi:hypothetical protein KC930_03655 [Candidatus Saccharibacteria bacterium]|nr:hypothetical protein [Candidatus Saccharibacteria bacterium]